MWKIVLPFQCIWTSTKGTTILHFLKRNKQEKKLLKALWILLLFSLKKRKTERKTETRMYSLN